MHIVRLYVGEREKKEVNGGIGLQMREGTSMERANERGEQAHRHLLHHLRDHKIVGRSAIWIQANECAFEPPTKTSSMRKLSLGNERCKTSIM